MTQLEADAALSLPSGATEAVDSNRGQDVTAIEFAPLVGSLDGATHSSLEMLEDVTIEISVELGRAQMSIGEVLGLKVGSVVELEKLAGESGDVYVNGTLVGRGEIMVVDDRFGIRIFEVVAHPRITARHS